MRAAPGVRRRRAGGLREKRAIAALACAGAAFLLAFPANAQEQHPGKATYDQWCAGCHGENGDGEGSAAAYMLPRPRDFTRGVYQIRTTASGEIPTDADIRRVIDDGMPGTAMPGWREKLSERQREDLVAYLKTFSRFFEGTTAEPVEIGRAPGGGDDAIEEGRRVYQELECWKCHGQLGRGDGQSAPTLTDDWDFPIRAADLSEAWNFTGGSSVEAIYARLRTGLDGTPMPSFTDAIEGGVITDEQLWRVAQYVRSLSPAESPAVREVVRVHRVEGALPSGPTDERWADAAPHYIPLVGQIIVKPRWFAPMVDGVWVQGMHNGEQMALLVRWHDPSRSPDPAWDEWHQRVVQTVVHPDGVPPTPHGPDRFTLQFSPDTAPDADRPYFLGGSPRQPVHQWRWSSNPDRMEVGSATGIEQFTAASGAAPVTHAAAFSDGEWRLQVVRPLAGSGALPAVPVGRAVPIAFSAADGSNGEGIARASVSAWYSMYLDVPTPPRVYVAPLSTVLLTAGLGLLIVRRAQRRAASERSTSEG